MPLLETLILKLSPAIAKTLLKVWLSDHAEVLDASDNLIDALGAVTDDALGRKNTERQLQAIADKVSVALERVITLRGRDLTLDGKERTANAIVEALRKTTIDAGLLTSIDMAPEALSRAILDGSTAGFEQLNPGERLLFETLVRELSQYIIDIASEFPQFPERLATELLRRDAHLISVADRILTHVEEIRKAGSGGRFESSEFESDYRRAIARNVDRMELFGVDLSSASRRHSLSVAFVSLAVFTNSDNLVEDGRARNVEAALGRSRRWLIRGGPGSGKTTLLNWIALRAATDSFPDSLRTWKGCFPFVIRLRQFSEEALPTPLDFCRLGAPALAAGVPANWTHSILSSGRGLVLVDGIDEVSEERRNEISDWLRDLTYTYPRSIFIVTSRPHAVKDDWLAAEHFLEGELLEMKPTEIATFIDHWHSAVAAELLDEGEKSCLLPLAENLKRLVADSRAISNLAKSPLLCAIICALHRDRERQIPNDRVELYEACCALLIERRDSERKITLQDYPNLTYRQKRILLEHLAYWMVRNGRTSVDRIFADFHLQQRLANMRDLPAAVTGCSVRRLFVERTGMLRELSFSYIDFTHRSFQEFLAAHAALDFGDTGVLAEHAADDRWTETIILAAALAGKRSLAEILNGLIAQIRKSEDRADGKSLPALLLAARCIEDAMEVSAEQRNFIESRMKKLKQPETAIEVRMFAAAGNLGLRYLAFSRMLPSDVLEACVRELIRVANDEALTVLESFASASAAGSWPGIDELLEGAWESATDRDAFRERVTWIDIPEENSLKDLNSLALWSSLTTLNLSLRRRMSLVGIEKIETLKELRIRGFDFAKDAARLRLCPALATLSVSGPKGEFDARWLPNSLKELEIGPVETVTSAKHLKALKLRKLTISHCKTLFPLRVLADLPELKVLRIQVALPISAEFRDLRFARQLTSLELLGLERDEPPVKIEDFSWLKELRGLQSLVLDASDQVEDFSWLLELKSLKDLTIKNLGPIKDLQFLVPLKWVQAFRLTGVPKCIDVPPELTRKVKEIRFL